MPESPRPFRQQLVFAAVLWFMGSLFLAALHKYPYYFAWDMDHVAAVDMLLINTGMLPDHVNHTSFGMYLLFSITQTLGYIFGDLSVIELGGLKESLNPIVCYAELVEFMRYHSPVICVLIAILAVVALTKMCGTDSNTAVVMLAFFGISESLVYHACVIRSELYSVLFWSVAVVLACMAARRRRWGRLSLLFASGVFSGLCFLTKIQALFYVAAVPLVYWLTLRLDEGGGDEGGELSTCAHVRSVALVLGVANVVVAIPVGLSALAIPIAYGVGTFAERYNFNALAYLVAGGLVTIAALQIYCRLVWRELGRSEAWLAHVTLYASGVVGAFLLHFLMFSDRALSGCYLLYDAKMVFCRQNVMTGDILLGILRGLGRSLSYSPGVFLVPVLLWVVLVVGRRRGYFDVSRQLMGGLTVLLVLALANAAVVMRSCLRDLLYRDLMLNFLTAILVCLVIRTCRQRKTDVYRLCLGGMIVLTVCNWGRCRDMTWRLDAAFHDYCWDKSAFYHGHFFGNQLQFGEVMEEHYDLKDPARMRLAQESAERADATRRAAAFVFPNRYMTNRSIGLVAAGNPVWVAEPGWRISAMSGELIGSAVVDTTDAMARSRYAVWDDFGGEPGDFLVRFATGAGRDRLLVLPRRDLHVLLFVENPGALSLCAGIMEETPLRIELSSAGGKTVFRGVWVRRYREIPEPELASQKHFFVLQTRVPILRWVSALPEAGPGR